jgi:hypothetical protein
MNVEVAIVFWSAAVAMTAYYVGRIDGAKQSIHLSDCPQYGKEPCTCQGKAVEPPNPRPAEAAILVDQESH